MFSKILSVLALTAVAQAGVLDYGHGHGQATSYASTSLGVSDNGHGYAAPALSHGYAAPLARGYSAHGESTHPDEHINKNYRTVKKMSDYLPEMYQYSNEQAEQLKFSRNLSMRCCVNY
ncbi:uncharacterized protein LOC126890129 [Diabrotica virgifera virgifera]|uniref:Uncharacterized protein n=1 Tax=Diabrotica virgifera virgifera TaxID=50390 RepID=A0ABM5KXL7_DIAVI|nr:uncharacterized protein LOC126890129 [Diabrotica virgifera virgifera]